MAIADDGRDGEVRYLGEIDNSPDAVSKLVAKLSRQYERLHFCYEAGPTGYGLHRQLTDLVHVCDVIAPTMISKRSGDRVKTNRRDSVTLAKLLRAGELRATSFRRNARPGTRCGAAPLRRPAIIEHDEC
jgi:transposase